MDKQEFESLTYLDDQGYRRWNKSHDRVHRTIAYNDIYSKNREKYPFDFKEYQIHHKDGDKENNRAENLELVHRAEHEKRHSFVRREQLHINYLKAASLWIFGIIAIELLSNKLGITGWPKAIMFAGVSISAFAFMLLVSREKEGVKYI
jgi:hypothetical protein